MTKVKPKKQTTVDRWIVEPLQGFISSSTTGSIVLIVSALVAILITNSPWSEAYHHLWMTEMGIKFGDYSISKNLHHWINDGLMAIFFFVVGLELKREFIAGELSKPKNAVLPIVAAILGMIVPAVLYLSFNKGGEPSNGWGVPMATDIAFALGILYLLGNKVPSSLKVFLTVLAIVDDLGAVLVIAIFYTSHINLISLSIGGGFLLLLILGNIMGVRHYLFYAIVGIVGVWLAFLMSGVHATIAAVLVAMTIPANVKVAEAEYLRGLKRLTTAFENENTSNKPTVTDEQLHILQNIKSFTETALTPLQRLEHSLHPFVSYIVMPIFALSNAGFVLSLDMLSHLDNVFWGTFVGLFVGKLLGVFGIVYFLVKLKFFSLPKGMNTRHLLGAGFLAGIGFTMSLFVAGLAFKTPLYIEEAKIAAVFSSVIAGFIGYFVLRKA